MTIKTLTASYYAGYTLSSAYSGLVIGPSTEVGGQGVYAFTAASITNFGTVASADNGINLMAGSIVTNGSAPDTTALISAPNNGVVVGGGPATVANFGTVEAAYNSGVVLIAGGSVTNGAPSDTIALISGGTYGVYAIQAATVANFGTVQGTSAIGVLLDGGGSVTNGSASDVTALISGRSSGVLAQYGGGPTTVTNFGTIKAAETGGVLLIAGGSVTNGAASDTTALISSFSYGVYAHQAATVVNFGTVQGTSGVGVFLYSGGSVTDGSASDVTAVISGKYFGVFAGDYFAPGNAATVVNYGAIQGAYGVYLYGGGAVTNGSASDTTALISARIEGVVAGGGVARVVNFGMIEGDQSTGVELRPAGTVINFGTISGGVDSVLFESAGDRLIARAGSVFIGEVVGGGGALALAGVGTISGLGGGGTLTGAVSASFSGFGVYEIGGAAAWTLAGSNVMAAGDTFNDRGAVVQTGGLTLGDGSGRARVYIANGATWTLTNDEGVTDGGGPAASRIVDKGALIKSGGAGVSVIGVNVIDTGRVEAASGTLDLTQAVNGTGALLVDASATLAFDSAVAVGLSVTFDGAAANLAIGRAAAFRATIGGFAAGDAIDLRSLTATGASVDAGDQLVVVNGARTVATLQLTGSYEGDTFNVGSDGAGGTDVTLGTTDAARTAVGCSPAPAATPHAMIAAMSVLGSGQAPGFQAPREFRLGPDALIALPHHQQF